MRHETKSKLIRFALIGAAGVAALMLSACGEDPNAPDLVIYNGKIVTVDGKFSVAQAAAVKDGKFTLVGDDKTVLDSADSKTVKVDLKGQTVLPGFNDSHVHQMSQGATLSRNVDLTNIHSITDIQNAIAARVKVSKPGEWIAGTRGWWEYELAEDRIPTRYDLDKVSPNNPVTIPGPHYSVNNSLALKLAGITKDSKDPQGGEIRKDAGGEPTGILFDNASRPVGRLVPRPTKEQIKEGVLKTIALNNSNGLTSIGEPSGDMDDMKLYKELLAEGKLTTRVDFAFSVDPALSTAEAEKQIIALGKPGSQNTTDGMIRADELGELGLDGAELTALLRNDFPTRPGYKGMFKVTQPVFNEFALVAAKHGWRLRPHAVGDGAIDEAITAFEYANKTYPVADKRWMIDHAFLLVPDFFPRVKALGLIINSQYMHNAQLGKLILDAWARPLADSSETFKDWVDAGIMFANGSDGPISYHAIPIYQIYGAVTRNTLWGGKLGPNQGITREQAIRSVTSNSAYTSFEEKVKGSIEPGKYADFVILSGDILTVPEDGIKDLKVLTTVLGGKAIYGELK